MVAAFLGVEVDEERLLQFRISGEGVRWGSSAETLARLERLTFSEAVALTLPAAKAAWAVAQLPTGGTWEARCVLTVIGGLEILAKLRELGEVRLGFEEGAAVRALAEGANSGLMLGTWLKRTKAVCARSRANRLAQELTASRLTTIAKTLVGLGGVVQVGYRWRIADRPLFD